MMRNVLDTSSMVLLQTQRLMSIFIALASAEQVLLNVVAHSEESATRRICGGVLSIGAGDTLGDSGWKLPGAGVSIVSVKLERMCHLPRRSRRPQS